MATGQAQPDNEQAEAAARLRPAIHPTYARLLCAHLYREGFDTATVLAGTRLQWSRLASDQRFLSSAQMSRLVARAIQLTERPWLGIEVGHRTDLSVHGPLGYAAIAAPDLQSVIDVLSRFVGVRYDLIGVCLDTGRQACEISLVERVPLGGMREFVLSSIVATFMQLMNTVSAGRFVPKRIAWPQPRPDWAEEYERSLPAPIEFDAPRLAVTLPASVLNAPSMTADPHTYRSAVRDCEIQLRRQMAGGTLSQRVYELLLAREGSYPSLSVVADTVAMSPRTLIRHLKAEATSYQALLDEVRQELAAWYLLETDLPVARIAERAGYRDTSNFSRTVRRWFGTTPQVIRRQGRE